MLVLAGCTAADPGIAEPTAAHEQSPTPEAVAQATQAELDAVFVSIRFVPGEYGTTGELLDSIYPGLMTDDVTCLAPFGAGWEQGAENADAPVAFGTSDDRSMTAVLVSTGDESTAGDLLAQATEALDRCAESENLFTLMGMPVSTQLSSADPEVSGTDETVGWRVTGDVGGAPFTLVGTTVRVGGDVLALVGWDPATNEANVPLATQAFVDGL
ncbi:hypothetical protein [Arenivirga flava]|uniref:Uncharacterized protein n=1 Tax=Arenivirga flava TaxID=1930060 RepID=A0AA37UTJ1_9MICO|nr:hypothetical protein [Arenivirga flava]GMA28072.1 hypothetical protein GCM10025874_13250 [Arenivirga flava]